MKIDLIALEKTEEKRGLWAIPGTEINKLFRTGSEFSGKRQKNLTEDLRLEVTIESDYFCYGTFVKMWHKDDLVLVGDLNRAIAVRDMSYWLELIKHVDIIEYNLDDI